MCGRYTLEDGMGDGAFSQLRQIILDCAPGVCLPRGEITPSLKVPVLVAPGTPAMQSWGFPRSDGRGLIINARAETADTKPIFRQSLLHRRVPYPAPVFLNGVTINANITLPCRGISCFIWRGFTICFRVNPILSS